MSIRDDLKAYIDGELPPERMEEIRTAAQNDPELQEEISFMVTLGEEIKSVSQEPEVVGLEATLARIQNPKRTFWSPVLAHPVVSLLVVIGCVGILTAILFPTFATAKLSARTRNFFARAEVADESSKSQIQAPAASNAPMDGHSDVKSFMRNDVQSTPDAAKRETYGLGKERKENVTSASPQVQADNAPLASGVRPPPNRNRLVVSHADMGVQVENVQNAQAKTQSLAVSLGGYVENSNMTNLQGETPQATVVIRVPIDTFDRALQKIRDMGVPLNESVQSSDVTLQYVSSTTQLKELRILEEQYLTMLRAARKMGEIMEIRDRLSQLRQQIASLDAQMKALKDQADLSTISVLFEQRVTVGKEAPATKNWAEDTWASAVNGLSSVGRFLGRVVIFLFVFSPLWIAALIVFWFTKKKVK
jgi:hypothetical protein